MRHLFSMAVVLLMVSLSVSAAPGEFNPRVFDFSDRSVVLDGIDVPAWQLDELQGDVILVIDRFAEAEGAVYAFSDGKALAGYLEIAHGERLIRRKTPAGIESSVEPLVVDPCDDSAGCDSGGGSGGGGSGGSGGTGAECTETIAYFFQDVDYRGSNMSVIEGQSTTFGGSWWNDRISSVKAAGTWTTLYEHHYWGGAELWIEGCLHVRSLHSSNNVLGYDPNFGDITSSIRVIQ